MILIKMLLLYSVKKNYHQIGNVYLDFDITVRDTAGNFTNASVIGLMNNTFAYCFKEAILSTTGGSDLEDVKYVGQVSTIIRLLTSKESDLSSCFDKNGENALDNNNPLKQISINNHTDANKGKIEGHLPLEHIFRFCRMFKKITKTLEFHLLYKMSDLQDIMFTTIGTDINITINSLHLYVPISIPDSQTQVLFNESVMNNYRITFDSWYTEPKISNDGTELQVDIGSAQDINSPKYLMTTFQTQERIGTPNKANNPAVFDTNHVTKYSVEIDGARYPKDGVLTNFEEISFLAQYRDLKLFYKEYVGEELLPPYVSYADMKNFYPIQVTDLRFQVDHITPKKIQFFEEFSQDPSNERLFVTLVRHRQIEMISDGNKIIEVKVI